MAAMDIAGRRFGRSGPLEQLLLLTTDGLDSGGFLEHLKLPHYVTFRSMVERKQAAAGRRTWRIRRCRGRRECQMTRRRRARMTSTAELLTESAADTAPAGILDEGAKREIRRAVLTAVCVPGYQVPFGSREMPVARGWGSGGLQVTLSVIGAARHREGDRPGR